MTKIASRIRKLLALSKSSNVHEAANAAAHAQRLMDEYRLGLTDLEDDCPDPWDVVLDEDALDSGVRFAHWKIELAIIVAEHNACRVVVVPDNRHCTIQLVGSSRETAVVREMYTWLLKQVDQIARRRAGKGRSAKDSFRQGMLLTIEDELKKTRRRVRQEHAGLVPARMGALAFRQRDAQAEALVDEITEGVEQDVGEAADLDAASFVDGIVLGKLVDLHGHRKKVEA